MSDRQDDMGLEERLRWLEGFAIDHDPATGEILQTPSAAPDANPKTRVGGMNKLPLHLVPTRPLAHVALAFADGGIKYQPYNWRAEPITSSVYYGAALRHLFSWWEGEDVGPDCAAHHLAHGICCLMMILDTMGTELLRDNRPPPLGAHSALMDELASQLEALRDRRVACFDVHDIAEPRK